MARSRHLRIPLDLWSAASRSGHHWDSWRERRGARLATLASIPRAWMTSLACLPAFGQPFLGDRVDFAAFAAIAFPEGFVEVGAEARVGLRGWVRHCRRGPYRYGPMSSGAPSNHVLFTPQPGVLRCATPSPHLVFFHRSSAALPFGISLGFIPTFRPTGPPLLAIRRMGFWILSEGEPLPQTSQAATPWSFERASSSLYAFAEPSFLAETRSPQLHIPFTVCYHPVFHSRRSFQLFSAGDEVPGAPSPLSVLSRRLAVSASARLFPPFHFFSQCPSHPEPLLLSTNPCSSHSIWIGDVRR